MSLTAQEQTHVRTALRFLRARCGGWEPLAKLLHYRRDSLSYIASAHRSVTATLAVRIARVVSVTVDDLLAGTYPTKGACPYCGHPAPIEAAR